VPAIEAKDPVVFAQVPAVELHYGLGAFEKPLELDRSDARLRRIVATDDVQNRHDREAEARVGLDVIGGGLTTEYLPPGFADPLVAQVVLRAFHRGRKDLVCVDDLAEPVGVPSVPVIGMETVGEKPKYALDRVAISAWGDLKNLVVVLLGDVGHR